MNSGERGERFSGGILLVVLEKWMRRGDEGEDQTWEGFLFCVIFLIFFLVPFLHLVGLI